MRKYDSSILKNKLDSKNLIFVFFAVSLLGSPFSQRCVSYSEWNAREKILNWLLEIISREWEATTLFKRQSNRYLVCFDYGCRGTSIQQIYQRFPPKLSLAGSFLRVTGMTEKKKTGFCDQHCWQHFVSLKQTAVQDLSSEIKTKTSVLSHFLSHEILIAPKYIADRGKCKTTISCNVHPCSHTWFAVCVHVRARACVFGLKYKECVEGLWLRLPNAFSFWSPPY